MQTGTLGEASAKIRMLFIDASEATHSARNAQPDRADKYRGHADGAKVGDGKGVEGKLVEMKEKPRGWLSFLK